jgi:broad specificity phosphatase PhoE
MFADKYQNLRPKRIFVLRHGQSEGNVDTTLFERLPDYDHSLTSLGRLQVSAIKHASNSGLQFNPCTRMRCGLEQS